MSMRAGGLALLASLAACTASAQAATSVGIPDGCGDVPQTLATVGDGAAAVPFSSARTPQFDIHNATITALTGGGVRVQLRTCAAIAAPQLFTGAWQVNAETGNNDSLSFVVSDGPYGMPVRSATISVWHTTAENFPPGGVTATSSEVYNATLPATNWSVQGNTVTWRLTASQRRAVPVGTTWTNLTADTWDGARITEDDQPGLFTANGPGTTDAAAGTGTLAFGS